MIPLDEDLYAQQVKKRASDRLAVSYGHGIGLRVLGAIQLLAGLMSIGLGVAAICTFASGYHIGYGIWAGCVFCITAILAIVSGLTSCHKAGMMTVTVTFCVMSICCAAAQLAIGVVAAVNDHSRSATGELSRERYYLRSDIYYERNEPFHYVYNHYCTHTYGAFTWHRTWGPIDILLAVVGFIEAAMAIATAALCCVAVCCRARQSDAAPRGLAYVPDLSAYNGAYPESVISEPSYRTK